jgi:hypothetical protein
VNGSKVRSLFIMDLVFIALGAAMFGLFAVYAVLLRKV